MTDIEIAAIIRDLAGKAKRLPPPSASRPEAFHEAKSDLAHELNVLADRISPRLQRICALQTPVFRNV